MQVVPLNSLPNQQLTVGLDNQSCQIQVFQTDGGLFMNLSVNNAEVVSGVLCQNRNRIVREKYRGFNGDFYFDDLQGDEDPSYAGLGARFVLVYLSAAELPEGSV